MKLIVELSLPAADPTIPQVRRLAGAGDDWTFVSEQPDGELYYRTKLNGALTLTGADYRWLYEQWERFPCCVEVSLNVFTPTCEGPDDELFWPGHFLMHAVRWDHTACQAEVGEILPRDGYDALFRVWETPVNLLDNDPIRTPFVAMYGDRYVSRIDNQGNQTIGPPDGNNPGTGYNKLEHVYPQGITLSHALSVLHTQTMLNTPAAFIPSITSSFYFALVNPVTGRKNLTKLLLAGSDAKRPASVTPAVQMTVTLKDFLSNLRALHNVYYALDPQTGHLRLEHYSWFDQRDYQNLGRVSLNLTLYPDALAKADNESVDVDGLFGVEELIITNNAGSFFTEYRAASVRYDDGCVPRDDKGQLKTNTLTAGIFWTDLYAGYSNPESVPDDSIFLCDIVPPGTYPNFQSTHAQIALANNGAEYPGYNSVLAKIGTNGYQSAALLFIDYHRHGRSFTAGKVNALKQKDGTYAQGLRMAMHSTTPTRLQEGIVIGVCCQDLPIDLSGYVKTNRFERGKLGKGVFNPADDQLTLDVVASSRCQQITLNPPDPGDDCPPAGTLVSGRSEQTYCDAEQQIVSTNTDIFIYADGSCGTYEIPGPTVTITIC